MRKPREDQLTDDEMKPASTSTLRLKDEACWKV